MLSCSLSDLLFNQIECCDNESSNTINDELNFMAQILMQSKNNSQFINPSQRKSTYIGLTRLFGPYNFQDMI